MHKTFFDLAIVGGGAAGLSVAAGAAQLGAKVVLLEGKRMGGDCLNAGCVPSKALLAAAKAQWQARHSEHLGIASRSVRTDFKAAMDHVQQVMQELAPHDSVERFEGLGVQVIQAPARFTDPRTLTSGEHCVQARRYVLATGSSPRVPPLPGLSDVPYLTNDTIFALREQPRHLLVVGGGPIGCELAQAFAMLGSQVTLLEGSRLLMHDEPAAVQFIKASLVGVGVEVLEGAIVQNVAQAGNDVVITSQHAGHQRTFRGSHLLLATGRQPNIEGLGLQEAGVAVNGRGLVVDQRLRTTNRRVYGAGDVVGGLQFTHVAAYHASVVLKNTLFRLPSKAHHELVPRVTYTSPELAHVGLTQTQAEAQGHRVVVTERAWSSNDRAHMEGSTNGTIQIVSNRRGRVLGVTIVGEHAGELLLPWSMAMQRRRPLRDLTELMVAYPTLSELSKRVAGDFYAPKLFGPRTRQLVGWLIQTLR